MCVCVPKKIMWEIQSTGMRREKPQLSLNSGLWNQGIPAPLHFIYVQVY